MKNNNFKNKIFKILFSILIITAWKLFKNRHTFLSNFKTFCREEKKEIDELAEHKESVGQFCRDSSNIFKDFFIPHECNEYRPRILRTKSLLIITLFVAFLKISVIGYLFFIYPYQAKMSVEVINRVLELTNKDRQENNLGALTVNPVLVASAKAKAQDLIDKNYFAHHSPDGKKPWDFISRDEYPYLYVGENLAMNFTTADSVHLALMNSPTHKKNILNEKYTEVGIAMLSGEIDGRKTNVLVELFATRKTEPQLSASIVKSEEPEAPKQLAIAQDTEIEVKKTPENNIVNQPKTETVKTETLPPKPEILEQDIINSVSGNPTTDEKDINPLEVKKEDVPKETEQLIENQELLVQNDQPLVMSNISPNKELEENPEEVIKEVENFGDNRVMVMARIIKYSEYIFMTILLLMVLALIVNIVIRIEVQHKGVIIQSMLVIVFITSLIYYKFNYLESGISRIFLV